MVNALSCSGECMLQHKRLPWTLVPQYVVLYIAIGLYLCCLYPTDQVFLIASVANVLWHHGKGLAL